MSTSISRPSVFATWMNRRGAGCGRTFHSEADLEKFLKSARARVTVRDSNGNVVGECHDRHEDDLPGASKWTWWYEPEAFASHADVDRLRD